MVQSVKRHHGSLKSKRQQAILSALKRGGWMSAFDLVTATQYPNPAEIVSCLRFNGIQIEKRSNFVSRSGTLFCRWRLIK